jgi:MFS family permease
MAPVGVAFAVLDSGGSASGLGVVLTASIVATIACLVAGGVVADRFSRRFVMLSSDVVRCAAQCAFAGLVLAGHPPLLALAGLSAVVGAGTGFFSPALTALTREIVAADDLHDANVLVGLAKNVGVVGGPALAGALVTVTSSGAVVAIDAATYAVSVVSLAMLGLDRYVRASRHSMLDDLRHGWTAWRSRPWIWITDIKFALFNAIVYAPLLVLGPVIADRRLGGAAPWA